MANLEVERGYITSPAVSAQLHGYRDDRSIIILPTIVPRPGPCSLSLYSVGVQCSMLRDLRGRVFLFPPRAKRCVHVSVTRQDAGTDCRSVRR